MVISVWGKEAASSHALLKLSIQGTGLRHELLTMQFPRHFHLISAPPVIKLSTRVVIILGRFIAFNEKRMQNTKHPPQHSNPFHEIFLTFLRLGLTAFGGPIAHLGYFREAFVSKRQWLSDSQYADLVALCQFLPGPASSQVGLGIGFMRGGYAGALAAWLGFTLPSALLMILFALGISGGLDLPTGVLHGLKIAAVAVVAQAIFGMATSLCPDKTRRSMAVLAACAALLTPTAWGQVGVIIACGLIGLSVCRHLTDSPDDSDWQSHLSSRHGVIWLVLFFALLLGLPLVLSVWDNETLTILDAYYQAGSLVFGGGHVVLPLLQAEVVPTGWVSSSDFLAGYGAAQAVPGPLFTFAAFLGAVSSQAISGWTGGFLALIAIFLPSFLLIMGALPFWQTLRQQRRVRHALAGVNAGVVGLLVAAFYQPVWISAIFQPVDMALALAAFAALMWWRCPSWLAVLGCALIGWVVS